MAELPTGPLVKGLAASAKLVASLRAQAAEIAAEREQGARETAPPPPATPERG